MQIAEQDNWHY